MEDVQALRRKRKPKGEPLGRALLGILANGGQRAKDPAIPVYMTVGELGYLVEKINDPHEAEIYNFYEDLYFSIQSNKKRQAACYNEAMGFVYAASNMLVAVAAHNNVYATYNTVPLIISKEERDRITGSYIYDRDFVIDRLMRNCNMDNSPKPIRKVLEWAQAMPCDDSYTVTYYTLPDGRSSEDYSDEEWQEILEDLFLQGRIKEGETKDQALDRINNERFAAQARHAFLKDLSIDGIPYKEVQNALEAAIFTDWRRSYLTAHYWNEADKKIRELIGIPLLPLEEHKRTRKLTNEYMSIVTRTRFPSYYVNEVADYVNSIARGQKGLTYTDLEKAGILHIGQLDYLPFKEYAETLEDGPERLENGIAVSEFTGCWPISKIADFSIQGVPAAEIMRGMSFVYSFNAIIDIYADVYGVPELTACKMDPEPMEDYIERYNAKLIRLWAASPEQEIKDEIRTKLEYIRVDEAKPDPDKVEKLREWFKKNKHTRYAHMYFDFIDMALQEIARHGR